MPNACVWKRLDQRRQWACISGDDQTEAGCRAGNPDRYYFFPGLRCNDIIWTETDGPYYRCCITDEEEVETGECQNHPTQGECFGAHGIPKGFGAQCSLVAGTLCEGPIAFGACCWFGECHDDWTEEFCAERDGEWNRNVRCPPVGNLECPRGNEQDGCRTVDSGVGAPRIPPGGYRWTYDLCATALFEPVVKYIDESYLDDGFARLQSVHPIRAVDVWLGLSDDGPVRGESCAYHYGDMDIGPDGFAEPYFCSEPSFHSGHRQTTIMRAAIQNGPEPNGYLDDGFAAFIGAYHAPYWIEAQFYSHIGYCGGPWN
jgi:hypothetical protein